MASVGVFHVIFLEQFDGPNSLVSTISALLPASAFVSAPFAGALSKKIGYHTTAIIGGIVGCLGLVLSMFATSIFHLIVTFGILTGIGLGLSYIPAMGVTAEQFPKYNTVALGLVATGIGVGSFLFPLLIRYSVATYGWRAFGFLTSAFSLVAAIVIDILGVDIFPIAFGCTMIFSGLGTTLGPPFAGWIFDATGVYPVSLYASGALMTISSLALIVGTVFLGKTDSRKSCEEASTELKGLP